MINDVRRQLTMASTSFRTTKHIIFQKANAIDLHRETGWKEDPHITTTDDDDDVE